MKVILAALITASLAAFALPAVGQPSTLAVGRSDAVTIEAGHGRVITLPGDAANVFVADPKVAEVRPANANSLFVFGTGVGSTTLAALDASGGLVSQVQITIVPNGSPSAAAANAVRRAVPGMVPRVTANPGGIGLGGSASTPDEANRALSAAHQALPPSQLVSNHLAVTGGTQVLLQVSIAEMSRNVTRELGINWQALGTTAGRFGTAFANPTALAVTQGVSTLGVSYNNTGASISAVISALAEDNLARMLAQPNLTAMSGETASFLVGGEFPIPVSQENNAITVAFKQYGISLAFVPTVLDAGRINLHVRTEVSALTSQGAVQLGNSNNSISIPAVTVRRADTTVELGSGQSFAIAGLLQDTVAQTDNSVPFLGELPVLGALFRSTSFQHNKSELVIIVTPVIAAPVDDRSRLHTPGEDYQPPNDGKRIFLLHQYDRKPASVAIASPRGLNGFVLQ